MTFQIGHKKIGGRGKGVENRTQADVKKMILAALDGAGGVDYLIEQSQKNPTAFMSLLGRVLPLTVAGDPNNPFLIKDISAQPLEPGKWLEHSRITINNDVVDVEEERIN